MRKSYQALRLAAFVVGTFASVLPSHSEQVLRLSPGIARSVVLEGAAAGTFTSIIGNPKIADVTFGPKNTFWFIGLTEGRTNIIVLDNKTGREMYSAIIEVGNRGRVHIHNKAMVTSYTKYLCDPNCTYDGEVNAEEPAALPQGHLQSSTVNSGTVQMTAPPGAPPRAQ